MNLKELRILTIIYLFFILFGYSDYSFCYFYNITKLPCPGCGLTRGIRLLFYGDFYSAIRYNLFSIFIFLIILLILFSFLNKRIESSLEKFLKNKMILWFFGISMFFYGIIRILILLKYPEIYRSYFFKIEDQTLKDFYESYLQFF
ncbi:MAG: DUF2752 domain-containing protein [Leptonema sp. (in: bacteria)]